MAPQTKCLDPPLDGCTSQEPYLNFRPLEAQAAALRALLNQCPGMKSKYGHPTSRSDNKLPRLLLHYIVRNHCDTDTGFVKKTVISRKENAWK